jgi:hypothetical protein
MDADAAVKGLKALVKNIPKELAIVSGKAAKRGKTFIAAAVITELNTTQKVVKQHITVKTKVQETGASVSLDESKRLSLRHFKAKHTKAGVTYKISKTGGKKTLPGGFMGPRPGTLATKLNGGVFRRVGKKRLPIGKVMGPSPWGVHKKQKQQQIEVKKQLKTAYHKAAVKRLKYQQLKKSGAI